MRKTQLALTLILAILLLTLSGIECVNLAKANPFAKPAHSTINVFSPENTTYYTNSFILNFSVVTDHDGNSVRYSLDGKSFGTVTNFTMVSREPMPPAEYFGKQYNWTRYTDMCGKVFTGLSDGNHSLTVYNGYVDPLHGQFFENGNPVKVYFVIDTSSPEIRNITVRNATYGLEDIPLNFTVNKAVSWMAYRLDSRANVTLDGFNTTLAGLPEGLHTLVIYANDTAGNMGASNTINFNVTEPVESQTYPKSSSAINVILIGLAVLLVAIVLGIIIYTKKIKRTKQAESYG